MVYIHSRYIILVSLLRLSMFNQIIQQFVTLLLKYRIHIIYTCTKKIITFTEIKPPAINYMCMCILLYTRGELVCSFLLYKYTFPKETYMYFKYTMDATSFGNVTILEQTKRQLKNVHNCYVLYWNCH